MARSRSGSATAGSELPTGRRSTRSRWRRATDRVPPALYEQLAVGGRLVLPRGDSRGQRLVKVVRTERRPRRDGVARLPLRAARGRLSLAPASLRERVAESSLRSRADGRADGDERQRHPADASTPPSGGGRTGSSSSSSASSARPATSSTSPSTRCSSSGADFHYVPAAIGSFLVAVTNNYPGTASGRSGASAAHVVLQGLRFLVVSALALGANLLVLHLLVRSGVERARRAGDRDRARHARQLRRQQALVVPSPAVRTGDAACGSSRRLVPARAAPRRFFAVTLALSRRPAAARARRPLRPVGRGGRAERFPPRLTERAVIAASSPSRRSPPGSSGTRRRPSTDGTFDRGDADLDGARLVGRGGRDRARGRDRPGRTRRRGVDRPSGRVEDGARPARRVRRQGAQRPGRSGSGSRRSSSSASSISGGSSRCRTLDLLVLVSFGVSLAFFNRGEVFRSVAAGVPPLVYLLVRMAWLGFGARPHPARACGSALAGVGARRRDALPASASGSASNVEEPRRVIDVGYAGVIGADRILDGRAPYGAHAGRRRIARACGEADADGEIRERIQSNGRCESANPRGDTYGPVAYLAYVPAVLTFGWSGQLGLAPGGARDGDRLRPARRARARPRRPALRRHAARRRARLRLARLSVHDLRAPRELERRAHAGARSSGASGSPRRRPRVVRRRARRLDEVRRRCSSRRSGSRTAGGLAPTAAGGVRRSGSRS